MGEIYDRENRKKYRRVNIIPIGKVISNVTKIIGIWLDNNLSPPFQQVTYEDSVNIVKEVMGCLLTSPESDYEVHTVECFSDIMNRLVSCNNLPGKSKPDSIIDDKINDLFVVITDYVYMSLVALCEGIDSPAYYQEIEYGFPNNHFITIAIPSGNL